MQPVATLLMGVGLIVLILDLISESAQDWTPLGLGAVITGAALHIGLRLERRQGQS